MTRDEIKTYFDLSEKVAEAIHGLPYRDACNGLSALQEMADIVGEQLPGGTTQARRPVRVALRAWRW